MAWLSNCPEIGVCVCVFSSLPFFCITYIFVCSLHLLVLFIFIYFFGKSLPLFRFNCVISFFFFFFSVAFQMRHAGHAVCVRFMLTTELCQSFRCTCANQLYAETYWTPWTPIAHPLPASYFYFRAALAFTTPSDNNQTVLCHFNLCFISFCSWCLLICKYVPTHNAICLRWQYNNAYSSTTSTSIQHLFICCVV